MKLIVVFYFLSQAAWATLTVGDVTCPTQFKGRVKDLIDELGSDHAYATQTVIFENLETLKGTVAKQVSVRLLKHGPLSVERGEDYLVQLRGEKSCSIDRI